MLKRDKGRKGLEVIRAKTDRRRLPLSSKIHECGGVYGKKGEKKEINKEMYERDKGMKVL